MGTDAQTRIRWDQDALEDCSPEDQVWGWSIRSSEVLHYDKDKFQDDVLRKMVSQGLLDKQAGAPAWTEPTSVKHGIRFATNMVVRVLQRVFKQDEKVRHPGCLCFWKEADGLTFSDRRGPG
jgi:hypothetical protein